MISRRCLKTIEKSECVCQKAWYDRRLGKEMSVGGQNAGASLRRVGFMHPGLAQMDCLCRGHTLNSVAFTVGDWIAEALSFWRRACWRLCFAPCVNCECGSICDVAIRCSP